MYPTIRYRIIYQAINRYFQSPCRRRGKVIVHIGQGENYNDITPQHQTVFNLKKQISSEFSCQKNCLYCWRRDLSTLVTQSKNVFSMEVDKECVKQKSMDEELWSLNEEKISRFNIEAKCGCTRRKCIPFYNLGTRTGLCWSRSRKRGSK